MDRLATERALKALLNLVAAARQDQRMAHSVGPQGWTNYLDNVTKLALTEPRVEKHDTVELLRSLRDKNLSPQMQRLADDFSDANPLSKIRRDLGINGPQDQKPFEIVVSNVQMEAGTDPASRARHDYWKLITGFDPSLAETSAFVHHGPKSTVLFLRHDTARTISDATDGMGFDSITAQVARETFVHEFVHTQVDLLLNRGAAFGQMFNEIAAERHPQIKSYGKDLSFLQTTSMIAGANIPKMIRSREAAKDPAALLNFLGDQLGPSHALMLTAMATANHGAKATVVLPFGGDPEHRRALFLDSLIMTQIDMVGSKEVKRRIDLAVKNMIDQRPETGPSVQLENRGVFAGDRLSTLLEHSYKEQTATPVARIAERTQGRSTL